MTKLDDDPSALEAASKLRSAFPAYGTGLGEDNPDIWNRIAATQPMNTAWGWSMFSMAPHARNKALDEHHAKLVAQGMDHMVASAYVLTAPLLAENVAISRHIIATDSLSLRATLPELVTIKEALSLAAMEYRLEGNQQSALRYLLEKLLPDLKTQDEDPVVEVFRRLETCQFSNPNLDLHVAPRGSCEPLPTEFHSMHQAHVSSPDCSLLTMRPTGIPAPSIKSGCSVVAGKPNRKVSSSSRVYGAFAALFVASFASIAAAYSYNPWVNSFFNWTRIIEVVQVFHASVALTVSCFVSLLLAYWGTKDEEAFRVATLAYCYTVPFIVVLMLLPLDHVKLGWGVLNFALLVVAWMANIGCAWYVRDWFWAQGSSGRADSRPWV